MFWRTYHSAEGVSMKTTALLHFLLTSPQKWELKSVTDMPSVPLVWKDKPGEVRVRLETREMIRAV